MGLTGLDIYKKLPKTNCGECGFPTCLAFAMKIAASQAVLEKCPYVSEEVKEELSDAAAPPIIGVTVGTGDRKFKVGEETVLFRHEKTFVNHPGYALLVRDDSQDSDIESQVKSASQMSFNRVGQVLGANLIAVESTNGADRFTEVVGKVTANTDLPLMLVSADPSVLKAGLEVVGEGRPLVHAATEDNYEAVAALAKEYDCPLVVSGDNGLGGLAELTEKVKTLGVKELVLDPGATAPDELFKDLVLIRRAALQKKVRPLGYPVITFPGKLTSDPALEALWGAVHTVKYGGIIVFNSFEAWKMLPLLVLRQNIYTDPQRPLTVDEGVYEMGKPDTSSPVLVTTNFSLTYFIVSTEVEASRIPSWLCVMDAEGLSVLTGWAAGKFVPERIAAFLKKSGIEERVQHNQLIIPGYVAQISGELEDELPDWKVTVGPREATDLPHYLKSWSPN